MGSHFLLQGIFLSQGLNPGLLPCRQTLYHLSHQGNPRRGREGSENVRLLFGHPTHHREGIRVARPGTVSMPERKVSGIRTVRCGDSGAVDPALWELSQSWLRKSGCHWRGSPDKPKNIQLMSSQSDKCSP